MSLVIYGNNPRDVQIYLRKRGVKDGIDPQTGLPVLVEDSPSKISVKFASSLKNKPENFRTAVIAIKSVTDGHGVNADKKEFSADEEMRIVGVANANIVDRMDERVDPRGLEVSNFIKNPVLILDHDYRAEKIVGRVESVVAEEDGVKFVATLGNPKKAPMTANQMLARSLVAQKLLQTVSIGFIPKKIKSATYDDEGVMVAPAVIEEFELLEISLVSIPANPAATFEQRKVDSCNGKSNNGNVAANGQKLSFNKINKRFDLPDGTVAQALILDKQSFSQEQAIKWALDHEFATDKVDEVDGSYRIRQRDSDDFDPESFRKVDLVDGVKLVIGVLREGKEEMDQKTADEINGGIKSLVTLSQSTVDGIKELKGQNEGIMKALETKGEKPKEEDDEEKKKSIDDRLKALEKGVDDINATLLAITKHINGDAGEEEAA